MSHAKRQFSPVLVSVHDTHGDVLYPIEPAPFYRCTDRPRRLPEGHPMAVRDVTPPMAHQHYLVISPLPGELSARVCAVMVATGGAGVIFGLLSLAGWL